MFVDKWEKEARNFRKQEVRETTYSTTIIPDSDIWLRGKLIKLKANDSV